MTRCSECRPTWYRKHTGSAIAQEFSSLNITGSHRLIIRKANGDVH
jgi:hypothetical protein